MSGLGGELSIDLMKAGLSTEKLGRVNAKVTALSGLRMALVLQEEEVHEAVREQAHILEAPPDSTFVVERHKVFTAPTDPPIEVGLYSESTKDRSELVDLFEQPGIAAPDAEPFYASRLEVSRSGIMAVNGEMYRLVDFERDSVKVSPSLSAPTE